MTTTIPQYPSIPTQRNSPLQPEYSTPKSQKRGHDCNRSVAGGRAVGWMRMMGADSVAYHQATVMGRADDHPGQALAYYASRGETPLVWGGSGAVRVGLAGRVTEEEYAAIYGPGGAKHPRTGAPLAATRRPGMALVISAHKSVA